MPNAPPALRAGAIVTEAELAALARAALTREGLTLTAAAKRLGVTLASVSDALNREGTRMNSLRLRIIGLAGYGTEGPLYRLTKQ